MTTQSRPFSASTNKYAYAQAFTAPSYARAHRVSLFGRLVARRHRAHAVALPRV